MRPSFVNYFFRYGDAPLIGTRIILIEEQNFLQVPVSESFDGRTCHESALSDNSTALCLSFSLAISVDGCTVAWSAPSAGVSMGLPLEIMFRKEQTKGALLNFLIFVLYNAHAAIEEQV